MPITPKTLTVFNEYQRVVFDLSNLAQLKYDLLNVNIGLREAAYKALKPYAKANGYEDAENWLWSEHKTDREKVSDKIDVKISEITYVIGNNTPIIGELFMAKELITGKPLVELNGTLSFIDNAIAVTDMARLGVGATEVALRKGDQIVAIISKAKNGEFKLFDKMGKLLGDISDNFKQLTTPEGVRINLSQYSDEANDARKGLDKIGDASKGAGKLDYLASSTDDIIKHYNNNIINNVKVKGTYGSTVGDSTILRNELLASGITETPFKSQAHHIVAAGDKSIEAIEARKILANCGIDINSAANGVFLPTSSNLSGAGSAVVHSGRNSGDYLKAVYNALIQANPQDTKQASAVLNDIREQLLEGTLRINNVQ
jgi:hypothetical protein